jgi:hypothetical protein
LSASFHCGLVRFPEPNFGYQSVLPGCCQGRASCSNADRSASPRFAASAPRCCAHTHRPRRPLGANGALPLCKKGHRRAPPLHCVPHPGHQLVDFHPSQAPHIHIYIQRSQRKRHSHRCAVIGPFVAHPGFCRAAERVQRLFLTKRIRFSTSLHREVHTYQMPYPADMTSNRPRPPPPPRGPEEARGEWEWEWERAGAAGGRGR